MRFYSVLLSNALLASTVLASSHPRKAGVTISSPSNGTFAGIDATFRIPYFSQSFSSGIDVYVALDEADGSDCSTSLKVGVALIIDRHNEPQYIAWSQQLPSDRKYHPLNITRSDTLHIGLTTLSDVEPAHAFVKIVDTGESTTVPINKTCGTSVTWGMSVFQTGGVEDDYINPVSFGAIALCKAVASSLNGQKYYPLEPVAKNFNMTNAGGATLVTTEVGNGTVTFKFVRTQ